MGLEGSLRSPRFPGAWKVGGGGSQVRERIDETWSPTRLRWGNDSRHPFPFRDPSRSGTKPRVTEDEHRCTGTRLVQ